MNKMEVLYTILGLAMFYFWIHSVVIIFKKIKGLTQYEEVVLWVGLVGFALFMIGYLN